MQRPRRVGDRSSGLIGGPFIHTDTPFIVLRMTAGTKGREFQTGLPALAPGRFLSVPSLTLQAVFLLRPVTAQSDDRWPARNK
jgi:hypothetical protein